MGETFDLAGRVAVVSGGSRGIGRAIAEGLARRHATVVVTCSNDFEAASSVAHDLEQMSGQRARAFRADVREREAVSTMVDRVVDEFGGIDFLVNSAATQRRVGFLDVSDDDWTGILGTNLDGMFIVGQEVAQAMITIGRAGAILNITSIAQDIVAPNMTPYSVSKAGAWALTRQMAYELAPYGIRVNALAPGLTQTDLNRRDLAEPEYRAERLSRIPLGFIGEPRDHVAAALFLLGDNARYVTGTCVTVDGGNSMLGPAATYLRDERP